MIEGLCYRSGRALATPLLLVSATPLSAKLGLAALAVAFALGSTLVLLDGDENVVRAQDEPEVEDVRREEPTKQEPEPVREPESQAPTKRVATKGPQLRAGDARLEFGTVAVGQELQQVFVLHNDGDADLEITKAKPSCGCAALDYDKVIPAGGEGRFELRISGKSVRAGNMSHRIEIESNDPNFWLMTIRAKVDPSLPAKGPVTEPAAATGR